jgi:hypothetical protein
MIDINEMRDLVIAANGLINADEPYTLYYDETNNIRRLHVRPDGFNVKAPTCFVLGGVAHAGPPGPLDIAGLRAAVRLQPSAKELKLAHLGRGDFLQLIASPKIASYLSWLADQGLFVHYQALDPLYWSSVDIIDSILTDETVAHMQRFHWELKNDLFTVLRPDLDQVAELFFRYGYPNVGRDRRGAFIGELRACLEAQEDRLPEFNYQVLKGVLQAGARVEALIYLEDEAPNTLIDSFSGFFIDRFSLFKNASHILDVEVEIQAKLKAVTLYDGDQVLQNYRFADSKAEPGVQISDPFVGLLGKFLTYIGGTDISALQRDRRGLTAVQRSNLAALNDLLDRSAAETPAFMQNILPLADMQRANAFLEGR